MSVTRVALLRAINVGGHNVKMADLRELFEEMGFGNVSTVIASGNVIFETIAAQAKHRDRLERRIEAVLFPALGYDAHTYIRTPDELNAIAQSTPFDAAHFANPGSTLYVTFLRTAPGPEVLSRIAALRNPVDEYAISDSELYWLYHRNLGESRVKPAQITKALGGVDSGGTNRNITSVKRIAAAVAR